MALVLYSRTPTIPPKLRIHQTPLPADPHNQHDPDWRSPAPDFQTPPAPVPVLAPVPVSVPPSPQYPRTPQELRLAFQILRFASQELRFTQHPDPAPDHPRNLGSLNVPTPFPEFPPQPRPYLENLSLPPFSPLLPTATPLSKTHCPPRSSFGDTLLRVRHLLPHLPPHPRLPRHLHRPPPARPRGKPHRCIRPLLGPCPALPRLRPPLPPPAPRLQRLSAAAVQWFDWIALLGAAEFNLFVDPYCVSIRERSASPLSAFSSSSDAAPHVPPTCRSTAATSVSVFSSKARPLSRLHLLHSPLPLISDAPHYPFCDGLSCDTANRIPTQPHQSQSQRQHQHQHQQHSRVPCPNHSALFISKSITPAFSHLDFDPHRSRFLTLAKRLPPERRLSLAPTCLPPEPCLNAPVSTSTSPQPSNASTGAPYSTPPASRSASPASPHLSSSPPVLTSSPLPLLRVFETTWIPPFPTISLCPTFLLPHAHVTFPPQSHFPLSPFNRTHRLLPPHSMFARHVVCRTLPAVDPQLCAVTYFMPPSPATPSHHFRRTCPILRVLRPIPSPTPIASPPRPLPRGLHFAPTRIFCSSLSADNLTPPTFSNLASPHFCLLRVAIRNFDIFFLHTALSLFQHFSALQLPVFAPFLSFFPWPFYIITFPVNPYFFFFLRMGECKISTYLTTLPLSPDS
ncbi:hypothetical protein BDN71DRAFT_1594040 [Pleurotus eryngii]|uniref:Uncharacterized protein n=1 Tax=Pleurotus eryngii TaxID=5323 RepID=A0A9P5ZIS9_PLEER|nr:hypothetical protein BDN71DRAFT_1594040 [Pleurotus eryngii]